MTRLEEFTTGFEAHRDHLRAVAYRMLGSLSESDDAVQQTWLRASRANTDDVRNLGGWLTTVVARVCLNMLRARAARPETSLAVHMPDPIVSPVEGSDPAYQAELADSVGLALLVVLDRLTPDERLAFVLHDTFSVPFDEIASILSSTPAAARQLASRARRAVKQAPAPDRDPARQHEVVDAFFAASRDGDFEALVALLNPDVVLRSDGGPGRPDVSAVLRGAQQVAGNATAYAVYAPSARRALVNGMPGALIGTRQDPVAVLAFTVNDGMIVAIDVLADPDRLRALARSTWID
ncbi:RNA polymerase sigma factor SigJ [Agromyces sp. SYSU K20354]|uniref:RNA polymerase sigma factor SigJ n=1 Tax=Agromyces cavernae TaxID=2898659 RepID=UPI001E5E277E|nr:RNA polymerase sigma factor SigJ [Agromyces cavernae]MCD2443112.1 RNA polymerase sigma factor SigJ [Agromyces cavernae]